MFNRLQYLLGPIIFLVTLFSPLDIEQDAQQFLAIFSLVISLWLFTDVPLFISGILGVTLSVILGVAEPIEAFSSFADPIIFLFLGGFLLAKALEATELDKRLAYKALSHDLVKVSPQRIVLAFLSLSFVLSMWISNTAAVAMLLPLTFGVLKNLKDSYGIDNPELSEHLLLGLAYSATAGGNVTPIGSPPNIIAIGHLKNLVGIEIGFLQWMVMALPISLVVFVYIYKRTVSKIPRNTILKNIEEVENYKKLTKNQKNVITIFSLTVFFWIVPNLLTLVLPAQSSFSLFLKNNISAPIVGIFFASLLFLLPLSSSKKILTSKDTSQIDWPALLLFGSGLSLGKILFKTGLSGHFSSWIIQMTGATGTLFLIVGLVFFTILFTELASNTASANIIIPIMIAFSKETGTNPLVIIFVLAIACNSAYMLPVATPPNIIVYGTNKIKKSTMVRAGIGINVLCAFILSLIIVIFV